MAERTTEEISLLIEEHVFGAKWVQAPLTGGWEREWLKRDGLVLAYRADDRVVAKTFNYCGYIVPAMDVAEAMQAKLPVFFELRWSGSVTLEHGKVRRVGQWVARFADMGGQVFDSADHPARAICHAALRALGISPSPRAVSPSDPESNL